MSGSVIASGSADGDAPSTAAASLTSWGTPSSAAANRIIANAMPRQMLTTMIAEQGTVLEPRNRLRADQADDPVGASPGRRLEHARPGERGHRLGHDEGQQDGGAPEPLEPDVAACQQRAARQAEHELADDGRPEHERRVRTERTRKMSLARRRS